MRRRALVVEGGAIMMLAATNTAFAAVPSHISIGFNHFERVGPSASSFVVFEPKQSPDLASGQ